MRSTTLIRLALMGLLLVPLSGGTALAQSFDKHTFFTFSAPVAVPGVTLPAGEYMFRVADVTQRDVLQVLSSDGRISYAQFFALRAYRPDSEVEAKPVLEFLETAEGMPAAVKTWWYPSDRDGYEFIYPKDQLRALTRGVARPAEQIAPATPVIEEPRFEAAPAAPALPPMEEEVAPQQAPVEEPRTELPKTAGSLPLVWLLGTGLLLGAGVLKGLGR